MKIELLEVNKIMGSQLMKMPIYIPWRIIATSQDMMDKTYCNKKFPHAWRSSMTISAYEPKKEDLPDDLCGDRITYLKVTCSITGYQPSKEETDEIYNTYSGIATEDDMLRMDRILSEYFACYGALVNVAVFPTNKFKEEVIEHIVKFDGLKKGAIYGNPLKLGDVEINVIGEPNNVAVDECPPGGDGIVELNLFKKTSIKIPKSCRVIAKISDHTEYPTTMKAYKRTTLFKTLTLPNSPEIPFKTYDIEGDDIDNVVFESPKNKAYLGEFIYYTKKKETIPYSLADYPHIIDFEPKRRDLYQSATETGEILTASVSSVSVDKSYGTMESSESAISHTGKYESPETQYGKGSAAHTMSHKRGDQHTQSSSTTTDASRERRESLSTTTHLSQMYNILNSYHQGTNRATFLMLPRPHTLPTTEFRTFAQGLREIEGIQEFILVVSRPKDIEGLCIEASLETGHFPEDVEIFPTEVKYERGPRIDIELGPIVANKPNAIPSKLDILTGKILTGTDFTRNTKSIAEVYDIPIEEGWEIDPTYSGDGVSEEEYSNDNAYGTTSIYGLLEEDRKEDYSYKISAGKLIINGYIRSGFTNNTTFHRKYKIYPRRKIRTAAGPHADTTKLIITNRSLCVCFNSNDNNNNCFKIIPTIQVTLVPYYPPISIVAETPISVNGNIIMATGEKMSFYPVIKEGLKKIGNALMTSWRHPMRHQEGEIDFIDTDYFKEKIKSILPKDHINKKITDIKNVSDSIVSSLGKDLTIGQALKLDLSTLVRKTKISKKEAINFRRNLIGASPKINQKKNKDTNQKNPIKESK